MVELSDLNERQRGVLVSYRRLKNGRGNRNDIRKGAGVEPGFGNNVVDGLLKLGLLTKYQRDDYGLTPEGYRLANLLIQQVKE